LIIDKSQILMQRQVKFGESNLYQLMFNGIGLIIPLITPKMLEVCILTANDIVSITMQRIYSSRIRNI
jgi:hypothetical protein